VVKFNGSSLFSLFPPSLFPRAGKGERQRERIKGGLRNYFKPRINTNGREFRKIIILWI
jgi:hypothetical protein